MSISNEAQYAQLGQLIVDMPNFKTYEWNTPEGQRWLGRATALVNQVVGGVDSLTFKQAVQGLSTGTFNVGYDLAVQRMTAILYHALAEAELRAPATAQNGFIPVGEPFTALTALAGVMTGATQSVLLIDTYADGNLLDEYALQSKERIAIRVLTGTQCKPGLAPAVKAWIAQFGDLRPLEVRIAAPKSLHDRLIIVDDRVVWTLGQSFNALGTRSPTALIKANEEIALLKIQAYGQIWDSANPMI